MAEKKTKILLRSDILANWTSVDPVLGKGEVAVVYDPAVTGERRIRIKVGDAVAKFSKLPYIADYDAVVDQVAARLEADEADIATLQADLAEEIARVNRLLAEKVDKELTGDNGTSYIFNEKDGGGSKFVDNEGAAVYVGTHDNIGGVAGVQIYADKDAVGSESTIIDITKNGAYYTKGEVKPGAQRDIEANEIATKGDVAAKQDKLPEGTNNFYLHKNAETGAIEWAAVEQVTPTFAGLEGDPRDNEKLSDELDKVLADAKEYTDEEIGKLVQIKYAVVTELPTPSADVEFAKCGTIYLKKEAESGADIYNEFICINEGTAEVPEYVWEQIGSTRIDLSNYYTKAEIDARTTAFETALAKEAADREAADEELAENIAKKADDFDVLDGGSASDWAD